MSWYKNKPLLCGAAHKTISTYRQDLQNLYVTTLITMVRSKELSTTQTIVAAHARGLAAEIRSAAAMTADGFTKEHLKGMYQRLEAALDPKNTIDTQAQRGR